MERRKLFSSIEKPSTLTSRRKLFAESEIEKAAICDKEVPETKEVICMDCGYRMAVTGDTSKIYCPKCGGTRFNVESAMTVVPEVEEEKSYSRRSLFNELDPEFQKNFSEVTNLLEEKLKKFSGSELSTEKFEKEFSDLLTETELSELGYGSSVSGKVKIFSDAFERAKLFSCVRMTITKTFDIDPEVFTRSEDILNRRAIINHLAAEDKLCPKAIMFLKKAHGIPLDDDNEDWIKDSGICNDLGIEFGGLHQELPNFEKIIEERYPDAPDNIIDLLKNHGTIRVNGNHIEIIK